MYWPCGVPRVYAYHGSRQSSATEEGEGGDEVSQPQSLQSLKRDVGKEDQPKSTNRDTLDSSEILGLCVAATDHLFATITLSTIAFWQNRPTVVLAAAVRSIASLDKYGTNQSIHLRPDCGVAMVQTSHGYLLIYSIEVDRSGRVYQQQFDQSQARRQSLMQILKSEDAIGLREVIVQLKRAVKIDAGISTVLAFPNDLLIATAKPPAVQCIKWSPDENGPQTTAELLSKMDWMRTKSVIVEMVHNRAMHLSIWIAHDGKAYAVQRQNQVTITRESSAGSSESETVAV